VLFPKLSSIAVRFFMPRMYHLNPTPSTDEAAIESWADVKPPDLVSVVAVNSAFIMSNEVVRLRSFVALSSRIEARGECCYRLPPSFETTDFYDFMIWPHWQENTLFLYLLFYVQISTCISDFLSIFLIIKQIDLCTVTVKSLCLFLIYFLEL
jgi:hypothetical protein